MLRECDRAVTCFPCADEASNPFANLSAEDPDLNIFLNVHFGVVTNVIPNVWRRDTCVGFCESSISQVDADDCARRRALECLHDPPLDPIPPEPPPLPPPQVPAICNQEVTCQDGSNCYTVAPCTIFASSQAEANAIARSLCEARVTNPESTAPCEVPALPPGPPVPPPDVPCFECCNCGVMVQIEGYTPAFFTFDPAELDVNTTTDACNPATGTPTRTLSSKTFSVPDDGWFFCTGDASVDIFFFKQFGSWFRMADAGFCVPLVDSKVLVKPLQAYPAGEPFEDTVTLKHYPYDLGFGTGAWDGKFTLTDDSFTTCAIQHLSAQHINGLGGFTIQLDQSGSGPSAVWTLSIRRYYSADDFGATCALILLSDWWIGEHVGETQCGTYSKTGGLLFTGPASLNLLGV